MTSFELDVLGYAKKYTNWHHICVFHVYINYKQYEEAVFSLEKNNLIILDEEREKFKITEKGLNFKIQHVI